MPFRYVFTMQIFLFSCASMFVWSDQWAMAFLAYVAGFLIGEVLLE